MPELSWLGDFEARRAAQRVPYRLLQPQAEVGDAATGNLLIQGDNLQALKALLPLYAGRVKCIFIDPPYNTKSAFEHYDDNLEHQPVAERDLPATGAAARSARRGRQYLGQHRRQRRALPQSRDG